MVDPDDDGRWGGLRFRLPPLALPRLFPDGLPDGRPGGRAGPLAAAVVADGLDAALLVASDLPGVLRALGVAAVAVALFGRVGLVALWELLAVPVAPAAAVAPTLTLLGVGDLLGLWEPEEVE